MTVRQVESPRAWRKLRAMAGIGVERSRGCVRLVKKAIFSSSRAKGLKNHRTRQKLLFVLHWLVSLRGSPEAIGRGVAIGFFVAFTPTIGLQVIAAAFLSTLFNANRLAALLPVWITNPATMPFVFTFTYWVGRFFWPGPPVSEVTRVLYRTVRKLATLDFWEIYDQFVVFTAFSRNIFIPLIIGGVLVGATTGTLAYFLTVTTLRRYHRGRSK